MEKLHVTVIKCPQCNDNVEAINNFCFCINCSLLIPVQNQSTQIHNESIQNPVIQSEPIQNQSVQNSKSKIKLFVSLFQIMFCLFLLWSFNFHWIFSTLVILYLFKKFSQI